MSVLTIHEAAQTTGWSPRMLRYIEQAGLVETPRSGAGYRLYGPEQLQRLRTLRELLERHGVGLTDVGFARRLQLDPGLREAVDRWLVERPRRPDGVPTDGWLRWEQDKHQRLLNLSRRTAPDDAVPEPPTPASTSTHHPEKEPA